MDSQAEQYQTTSCVAVLGGANRPLSGEEARFHDARSIGIVRFDIGYQRRTILPDHATAIEQGIRSMPAAMIAGLQ